LPGLIGLINLEKHLLLSRDPIGVKTTAVSTVEIVIFCMSFSFEKIYMPGVFTAFPGPM
jgi:hypothetical protein